MRWILLWWLMGVSAGYFVLRKRGYLHDPMCWLFIAAISVVLGPLVFLFEKD